MEANLTWLDFFKLIIALIGGSLILRALLLFLPQFFKRKSVSIKLGSLLERILEIYRPVALLIMILGFVGINYKIHGVLFLLLAIVSFSYIKSYISGVLFKINPLVSIGSNISTGDFKGYIRKFLFFGMIVNEMDGNRFINYSYIDKNGFSINQNDNNAMRRTIYLYEQEKIAPVLDLLFENPLVNFNEKPSIKKTSDKNILQLQITLEKGVQMEALQDYFSQNNIKNSITKL